MLHSLNVRHFWFVGLASMILDVLSDLAMTGALIDEYGLYGAIGSSLLYYLISLALLLAIAKLRSAPAAILWLTLSALALSKSATDAISGPIYPAAHFIGNLSLFCEILCAAMLAQALAKGLVQRFFAADEQG